jgi:hypothetical protein
MQKPHSDGSVPGWFDFYKKIFYYINDFYYIQLTTQLIFENSNELSVYLHF